MRWRSNRTWRIVLVVLVVLGCFRLALPYIVKRYVNNRLAKINGYHGQAADVAIHLTRLAYDINDFALYRTGQDSSEHVIIPTTNVSVDWDALFTGSIACEMTLESPTLMISTLGSNKTETTQPDRYTSLLKTLDDLTPIKVNRIHINEGEVALLHKDFNNKKQILLNHIQVDALNLSNAKDSPEELPSRIFLQALSAGNGQLNVAIKANVAKKIPDIDMDLRFENVDMVLLKNLFDVYTEIDITAGKFKMFAELSVEDGILRGYVKPLFSDVNIVQQTKLKIDRQPEIVWESIASILVEADRFNGEEFITTVTIDGEIAETEVEFWPAVWNVFSNAFVESFNTQTEESVSLAVADKPKTLIEPEPRSRKELRKEKRREKRAERKRNRREKKSNLENNENAGGKSDTEEGNS